MRYSKSRFLLPFWLLLQLPLFLFSIIRERNRLKGLIQSRRIDRVISDSRYGLRSRKIPCIFITHQLCILPVEHPTKGQSIGKCHQTTAICHQTHHSPLAIPASQPLAE